MTTLRYCLCILFFATPLLLYGQQEVVLPASGMTAGYKNYTSFAPQHKNISEEARSKNRNNLNHPELGMLFAEAPCTACYELIGARTETSKTFIKEGTGGRDIMLQSSTEAMHYRDTAGVWRTIKTQLEPSGNGIYSAAEQPVPVSINTKTRQTSIGNTNQLISFNRNLELVYVQPNGKEQSLGKANWKKHTAGADGVYVTGIWEGIDMEITVARGNTKTNFYINRPMPAYADGKLLIRDHLQMSSGLNLYAPEQRNYIGNLEIRNTNQEAVYLISAATLYEKNDPTSTLQMTGYNIKENELDIIVPGNFLNRSAAAYPVVVDPLVSAATTSTVGGSSYSPTKTIGCNYINTATVPANVTVTDVRWTFNYVASGGALLLHGAVDFTLGTCRSPGVPGFFWYCNLASAGTCTGTNVSIMSDIAPCILPPQCPSYPLNLNMRFYQNFAATTPCATTYVTSGSPLTVTVFGRTLETGPVTSAGGLTSICLGQSVTLSTVASFGVPPYSYVWNPGGTPGNPATLTPAITTPYTVTVTDACGNTATASQTILVAPIAPNTGSNIVCVANTTTLANPTGTGSWSSSNIAVATVAPSTGIVTGVSPGTATISYTTPVGCYATTIVTVTPMPGTISGTASMCAGATTTLSNPTPGGTWSSSTPGIATIGAGTGIVTGIAPGTSTVTYTTSPGCTAIITVTVHPNPAITATTFTNPTTCGATDGTITLDGLIPGITYTVSYVAGSTPVTISITANTGGQIIITGLNAGIYSGISVKSPEGCTAAAHTSITLADMGTPPIPVAGNNSPICDGGILNLTATSAPGVSYIWSGPGGFTSTLQNPEINPATTLAAGTYSVTATLLGCTTLPGTTTVTINMLPNIGNIRHTSPLTCGGSEGSFTLEGLTPGISYNVGFMKDGVASFIPVTADALGNVTVNGRSSGTYTNIFVVSFSCVSNLLGPVTLTDPPSPPPPVISSNAPICVGLTLQLYGNNDSPGGTYSWSGPNGFSANEQNPSIPYATAAAQGVYTLSYTRFNCTSTATADITLQPVIKLTDVSATKYQIPFGDSVQLNAAGATYYHWTPHNGTIRNHYIPDPFVTPKDSITMYTIHGHNEWGCHDSADITIRVIFDEEEFIPTAFTPNGDGKNDIFRIGKMKFKKLIDFTIYNRWGQEVYHNPYDPYHGWDGTYFGKPQDMGVYFYSIILETASGKVKYYKGDVSLIR